MASAAQAPEPEIAVVKIRLNGPKPPIWRRVQVDANVTLARLHLVIQAAMGWSDAHLHAFRVGDREYGVPDPDWEPDIRLRDDRRVRLNALVKVGDTFGYEYDFGDSWDHVIKVEAFTAREPRVRYPRVVAGARACPPEDVGGVWGYADLLAILADPDDPERADRIAWLGGEFDPEAFDLVEVNREFDRLF
jgi:hypothetical protein